MKELVEKIIYCDYGNLNNYKFPKEELFGLVVKLDNIEYEFLLYLVDNSDKIINVGSGAFNENTNHDRSRPWFNRWSWSFEDSRIFYNDPTLYLSDEIYGPWCIGTENNWHLINISRIITKIANILNIDNSNLIFFGSSSGGFTSIMLSTIIKESVALAEIPQFNIATWGKNGKHLKPIINAGFPHYDFETFIEKYNYRINILEFIKKEEYVPNAYLILDCSAEIDFETQYIDFFERLNELPFSKATHHFKIIINGKNLGHAPLPAIDIIRLLRRIKNVMDDGLTDNFMPGDFNINTDEKQLKNHIKTLNSEISVLKEVNNNKNIKIACMDDEISNLRKGILGEEFESFHKIDVNDSDMTKEIIKYKKTIEGKNNIIHYLNNKIKELEKENNNNKHIINE